MKNIMIAFITGIIMGLGLCISQMVNPAKIIAFLDIFGNWDPSLALVMGGALLVTGIAFRFVLRKGKPYCAESFSLPTKKTLDAKLLLGSALFGIGWGLSGFCPAPAVASLAYGLSKSFVFVGSMLIGMLVYQKGLSGLGQK